MKFAAITLAALGISSHVQDASCFVPFSPMNDVRSGFTRMSLDPTSLPETTTTTEIVQTKAAEPVVQTRGAGPLRVRYSEFLELVQQDRLEKVTFSADGKQAVAVDTEGARLKVDPVPEDESLIDDLAKHKVDISVMPSNQSGGGVGDLLQSLLVPALIFGGLFFLSRRGGGPSIGGGPGMGMGGPGGMTNPMNFGKMKVDVQMVPDTGVSFDDVAGCDQAKGELVEVVDFLKNPQDYTTMGVKVPRGVLLDGPPGTGKTLLARAVAGEAGVPFISIAGSEFVEMFVGVGASRVRDVFGKAKSNAPCIIFIDEIDAVGRKRGTGMAGGNDEREQTINQILTEMDGFQGNTGVIVMAATNRPDVLDDALVRPGRFDRKVTVGLPDTKGRLAVLGVHSRNKPFEPDVDLEGIARRTPGFSGAQLENVVNEAAIFAVRKGRASIGWNEIDEALDRVTVGYEKKGGTVNLPQLTNEIVAYHEAGHAIAGAILPDYDAVQKISIIPRSNGAGGITFFSPQDLRTEGGVYSRQFLESQLIVAFGGRVVEEIIFGEDMVTSGADSDLSRINELAESMVTEYGFSDIRFRSKNFRYLGSDIREKVDKEVSRLTTNSYKVCRQIILDNMELLHYLAAELLEREVVTAEEFELMLVKFKPKTYPYDLLSNTYDEKDLPFQGMPVL